MSFRWRRTPYKITMDAFLESYGSAELALAVKRRLDAALRRRNFTLRKWRSNDWYVLSECVDVEHGDVSLEMDQAASVLGLKWQAQKDHFRFDVKAIEPAVEKYTKRLMASEIARVFDPTGFLSHASIMDKAPTAIGNAEPAGDACWKGVPAEIHWFCNASQDAYAAVCYLRSIGDDGEIDMAC